MGIIGNKGRIPLHSPHCASILYSSCASLIWCNLAITGLTWLRWWNVGIFLIFFVPCSLTRGRVSLSCFKFTKHGYVNETWGVLFFFYLLFFSILSSPGQGNVPPWRAVTTPGRPMSFNAIRVGRKFQALDAAYGPKSSVGKYETLKNMSNKHLNQLRESYFFLYFGNAGQESTCARKTRPSLMRVIPYEMAPQDISGT